MRIRTRVMVAMMVLCCWAAAAPGARASHGADDPAWISQAGNGQGASTPLLRNFSLRTALFDAGRFGRGLKRYAAWGTVNGTLSLTRSDDGVHWDAVQPVLLRNATGQSTPFLLEDIGAFADVVYTGDLTHPFAIYYHVAGGSPYQIASIHRALSPDGTVFEQDMPIRQSLAPGQQVITESCCAAWNSGSLGPTDVIVREGGSTDERCGSAPSTMWSCRYVMFYEANDGDREYVGLAASGDGLLWHGRSAPVLSPGAAGTWDDNAATLAHVRETAGGFVMYYSGGRLPDDACFGGGAGCWSIGVATSGNGLTWAKAASNPAVPRSLLEAFSPDDPSTLWSAQALGDEGYNGDSHSRILFTRITNAGARDVFMAYTNPAPDDQPSLRISEPKSGSRSTGGVTIELFASDTLGANPGIDASSFTVKVDGTAQAVTGLTFSSSLITALRTPAIRIGGSVALVDGLHTFEASIKDLDGNTTTVSSSITIDTGVPSTTITSAPSSPAVMLPGGTLGTITGSASDPTTGSGLARLVADVVNPLGQVRSYEIPASQTARPSPYAWTFSWVMPSLDPHFLLPGPYEISIRARDHAGNVEGPSAANTRRIEAI